MAGLITTDEALAALTTLTAAQISELSTVIDHSTSLLESYCEQALSSQTRLDLLEPGQTRTLRLSSGNVTSIQSIRAGSYVVLTVAGPTTADRATVTFDTTGDPPFTTATGLTLWSRTAGVDTTTDLSFATYPTLAALAAAINAVSGWKATVAGPYGTFATADLEPAAGPRGALLRGVDISAFVYDIDDYDADMKAGVIRPAGPWVADVRRYPDRMWGSIPRYGQIRVAYTAGFLTVPADLKRIAIMTIQSIFADELVDGHFQSEKSPEGYQYVRATNPQIVPIDAKAALNAKYVRRSFS